MSVFKRIGVTYTEWGLFGLRWALPASLFIFAFLGPGVTSEQTFALILFLGVCAAASNLLVGILLVNNYWAGLCVILAIALDVSVVTAAVYAAGARLAWLGLMPAVLAGVYFGWLAGLATGGGLALILLGTILLTGPGVVSWSTLTLLAVALPSAGPLAALLADGRVLPNKHHEQERMRQEQQALLAARRAKEYMSVVYDMAEVLSASKLDPHRVLTSAVNFGLEGLERVGVKSPLFGAILLFDNTGAGLETVLRVGCMSSSMLPDDQRVAVPGIGGAIGQALRRLEPTIAEVPGGDAELRQFGTFRACQSVLCLPLSVAKEIYGVMLIGSQETGAFKDMHVELMRAVANQAAASLNNAKLYVALREQRDRIVEVEKSARAQLAADLHDGPTQSLSAITMRLNYIRRLLDRDPAEATNELYQLEELARRTTKEVRAMLFELRPKSLEKGLEVGLQQLAAKAKDTYDQDVEVQVVGQCDRLLDSQTTLTLFSIATEAVNNARKHANADLIRIMMGLEQDMLVLVIEDNGRGFDLEKVLAEARVREGHLGLLNLFERAALVDGAMHIDTAPGKGTRVAVAIPLEVLRQRKAEEMNQQPEEESASLAAD